MTKCMLQFDKTEQFAQGLKRNQKAKAVIPGDLFMTGNSVKGVASVLFC